MADSPAQRRFGQDKKDGLPGQCRRCPVRFACQGECPKNRILASVDGEPGLNWLCEGYFRFFRHIDGPMKTMAGLLRREQDPARVMALLEAQARGWPGLSKNDPCPCGSGQKLKRCHGA
jgi:uncharacterized protein